MTRPTRRQRLFEAISQVLCVLLVDGDSDEMLSSWAWRNRKTNPNWERWINWLFNDPDHCKDSYEWERQHYNLDRFKDAKQTTDTHN
ncbi:MAG: hypothetical protein KatS3mg087_1380 [Patescibacteria group bacterium]|nr:MAG: hypothetical protein KatS3mg087_1380 [Patescibacteria group bacterium]